MAGGLGRLSVTLPSRRTAFLLTPLIDVIFLLLKFFMLTSLIAPYGLLQLSSADGGSGDTPSPAQPQVTEPDARPVTLRISRGLVTAGDKTIAIAELPEAIAAMKEAGAAGALLLTSPSATVQDVVSVLEAFKVASFGNVTLISRAAQ